MDCKDCMKKILAEQIKMIGEEIRKRIGEGTRGNASEILELAKVQHLIIETKKIF